MQTVNQERGPVRPWIATVVLSTVVAFGVGFWLGHPDKTFAQTGGSTSGTPSDLVIGFGGKAPSGVNLPTDFNQFWKLWTIIHDQYYQQPTSDKQMFYGAMSGLAASMNDPYTVFFPPTDAKSFSDSLAGKFDGIGAEIGEKDGQLEVIAPLPGTPAEKAGLLAQDAILDIDKKDTTNMSSDQAVSLIRGTKGTKVVLTIGRVTTTKDAKGKAHQAATTFDVTIVRDTIVVKSVNVKWLKDGIAEIEINHFDEDTASLFSQDVADVVAKNPKGIILDLRNDPGGYLDRATAVAGEWVGEQLVVEERQKGQITEKFNGTGQNRLTDIPTVVLVNGGTASAAEIVAGALQDYAKAKIVGTKTFGKGVVQNYIDLGDGSAIKVTVAEWLTPKARSINKTGIQPDVQVDLTQDDAHANRDPQLDKALELLTGKPTVSLPVKTTTKAGSTSSTK